MSEKKSIQGQVTGYMTIKDSNKLPLETKQKIVSAPEGFVRKLRKVLVDQETGEKVILEGKMYIGGCKDGKPIGWLVLLVPDSSTIGARSVIAPLFGQTGGSDEDQDGSD